MELIANNLSLIENIKKLTFLNQLVETIVVDDTVGLVDVDKFSKESDVVIHTQEKINYKLKSTRLIIKSNRDNNIIISDIDIKTITKNSPICDCISRNTNLIFSKEFENFKNTIKYSIDYFNQGFFKKIFIPTNIKDILRKVEEIGKIYSWIIIPKNLEFIFADYKIPEFEDEGCKMINNWGMFNNLAIYMNPDQSNKTIYFGRYDSLTLIINKNLKIEEIKTFSDIYTDSKKLSVEYLFIEGTPISSLTIN